MVRCSFEGALPLKAFIGRSTPVPYPILVFVAEHGEAAPHRRWPLHFVRAGAGSPCGLTYRQISEARRPSPVAQASRAGLQVTHPHHRTSTGAGPATAGSFSCGRGWFLRGSGVRCGAVVALASGVSALRQAAVGNARWA